MWFFNSTVLDIDIVKPNTQFIKPSDLLEWRWGCGRYVAPKQNTMCGWYIALNSILSRRCVVRPLFRRKEG